MHRKHMNVIVLLENKVHVLSFSVYGFMNDFLIQYRHKDRDSKRGQIENVATIMRLLCDAIIRLSIASIFHPTSKKEH